MPGPYKVNKYYVSENEKANIFTAKGKTKEL
jgi:non-ribosomal peptide synthetase component E (peptide arylation enzyme)